jgi:threonine/homoserine/homoserine lactone efflux protein
MNARSAHIPPGSRRLRGRIGGRRQHWQVATGGGEDDASEGDEVLIDVIGDLLPLALGVALSPIPIVAVILMLSTPRAKTTGTAFAIAWIVGLVLVSAIVLLASSGADEPDSGAANTTSGITLAIGLVFLVMAWKQWQARPKPGTEPELPKWMTAVDHFTAPKAFGLGILLSALNPKNLALTVAASASIARAGLSDGDDIAAIAVFVAIGSITVVGAVLFYLVAPKAAAGPLESLKQFMAEHNAVIMTVLLLLLGAKMLGTGLGDLSN